MDKRRKGHIQDTCQDWSDDTASEITLSELGEQQDWTQPNCDTVSATSDYIVIETGSDKSYPGIVFDHYNVRTAEKTESGTSDQETITDSNGTVDHGFEDGGSFSSVKPAVSVEDEMQQRHLEDEILKGSEVLQQETEETDISDKLLLDSPDIFYTTRRPETPDTASVHMIAELPSSDELTDAVKNDAPHLVNDLINKSSTLKVYTAFLTSITLGRDHISKLFLEHPKYDTLADVTRLAQLGRVEDHISTEEDAKVFKNNPMLSAQMTPIMLASLRNQYEIVQALMDKGERIEEPHNLTCSCDDCDQLQSDQLRAAKLRLNTYKSLSCNAYVVLANDDPIYTAFELRQKLVTLSNKEKHYKAEYQNLADQISGLAGMILDKVLDGEELDTLLNEKSGSGLTTYDNLARLKLAIRYKEKRFVAHPACQKKLASLWLGSMNPKWVDGVGNSIVFFILLTIVYPFMAIPYWLWPQNRMADFLRTPIVKFTGSTSAYFVFMGILMASSFSEHASTDQRISEHPQMGKHYLNYLNYTSHVLVDDHYIRFHDILLLNMLLCVWLLGMIWENIKKILHEGTTFFTDNMFNLLNFTSLGFYVVSFGFRFHAFAEVQYSITYFSNEESWQALAQNETVAIDKAYWLSSDRRLWKASDSTFIAEAVYSLATIFSITKITYVFTISERLGPLLISLVKMMEDVFAFMVLFVFIIVAFVVGFHNLYWYYYTSSHIESNSPVNFSSITKVVELFFWSIFGLVELEEGKFSTHNKSELTSIMAYVLFAIYDWMMAIILINMLIAMMSRSYEVIAEMEDTEWKFARTKLFLEYMRDDSTMAYPYNLVPTWKGVYLLWKSFADDWCYRLAGRQPRKARMTKLPKKTKKPRETKQQALEMLAISNTPEDVATEGSSCSLEETPVSDNMGPNINTEGTSQDSAIEQDTAQSEMECPGDFTPTEYQTEQPKDEESNTHGTVEGENKHDTTGSNETSLQVYDTSQVADTSPHVTDTSSQVTETYQVVIDTKKKETKYSKSKKQKRKRDAKKDNFGIEDIELNGVHDNQSVDTDDIIMESHNSQETEELKEKTPDSDKKVVPSGPYKVVIKEVVKRFIQKGTGGDESADGIEQLQTDMSGLRQELMSNIFRQDQERAVMASNIIKIQKDMVQSQEAFTLQHAHLKLENENRIAEMKSDIKDLQAEVCQTLETMNQFLIGLRKDISSQIKDTKERVFEQIKDVRSGMNMLGEGLQNQARSVLNIHGTLENQVKRVNTIYGALSHLRSDVTVVQGTLAKSVFTQGDMEIVNSAGETLNTLPEIHSDDVQSGDNT